MEWSERVAVSGIEEGRVGGGYEGGTKYENIQVNSK